MIYTFNGEDPSIHSEFNRLISELARIRHNHVLLFVGACITPPDLAVVTSVSRGISLYQHQLSRPPLPYHYRLASAKQVSFLRWKLDI